MLYVGVNKYRLISMIMVLIFVVSVIPANIVWAAYVNFFADNSFSYTLPDNSVNPGLNGMTGLPDNTKLIQITLNDGGDNFNLSNADSLKSIIVMANGKYDETYGFNITYNNNILSFEPKSEYKLLKHTLYTISIPQGTFIVKNGTNQNNAQYFSFVTSSENGALIGNILKKATVGSDTSKNFLLTDDANRRGIDYHNGTITLEFVDDIELSSAAQVSMGDYITINSTPIDSNIPTYNNVSPVNQNQDLDDFNVSISNNKLVFSAIGGSLKDFADYTITLQKDTVFLKNSLNGSDTAGKIGNAACTSNTLNFKTDYMLSSTTPANNQEGVSLEPAIQFEFKYPIADPATVDKSKIKITEGGVKLNADVSDIILSAGSNKILNMNVSGLEGRSYPFRPHALYKITLEAGIISFADYTVSNPQIDLYFITGGDGKSPEITGYSSNLQNSDDIRYLNNNDKSVVLSTDKVTDLGAGGSVYIHFDRTIRQDTLNFSSIASAVHLYKMPKADEIRFDANGKLQDTAVTFMPYTYTNSSGAQDTLMVTKAVYAPDFVLNESCASNLQEIEVGSVEIASLNILKITPKQTFDSLTKYKIVIDKGAIEDSSGVNIESNIDFTFWTKADSSNSAVSWKRPDAVQASDIKENNEVPYKSYTINGTPRYSASEPIILYLDGEVIVKPGDKIIKQTPIDPTNERRITFDALENISLENVYNTAAAGKYINIKDYQLKYSYDNGNITTKIYLYPEDGALGYGTYYRLTIPEGVFVTRSGNKVSKLEVNFVTGSDAAQKFGAYKLEDNSAAVATMWEKGEWTFKLFGYNFHEYDPASNYNLTKIKLYDSAANRTITIGKDDIQFVNVTELIVKIRGSNAQLLSKEEYTGEYTVSVCYTPTPTSQEEALSDNFTFTITSKGKPKIKEIIPYPSDTNKWTDEKSLVHPVQDAVTTGKYFMKITYEDIDGKLAFDKSLGLSLLRDASTVYGQGSSNSMIDSEFISSIIDKDQSTRNAMIDQYIFTKNRTLREAYLFIPIRQLQASLSYNVMISPSILSNDAVGGTSDAVTWAFSTMHKPVVFSNNTFSVPEGYDSDQKIIITGSNFYPSSVKVYFNEIPARAVNVMTDSSGNQYLEVYLPYYSTDSSSALRAGTYSITVSNDANHERISYGALSVIKREIYTLDKDAGYKGSSEYGVVKYDYKVSEDTLDLSYMSSTTSLITLNLDDIMGTDVWTRKIKYTYTFSWVTINKLQTLSKWANIALHDLTLKPSTSGGDAILKLGRVDAALAQTLKSKLEGKKVKSEMIQVTGDNFSASMYDMVIPFTNSNGNSLKVMRYDESSRSWLNQEGSIDRTEKAVRFTSFKPGIFVVVE